MKILFVSPSYKPAYVYGGPTVSVSELAEALVSIGHSVTVYTTTANGKKELDVLPGKPQFINGVTVYYFKRQTGDHTHVSIGLWRRLWATAASFDVVHLQSWWSLLIIGAAAVCRVKKRTFIVSPRGMLSSYSFQNQHNFLKKIIHHSVGLSLLRMSRLHATTNLEWKDCLRVNTSWTGFILPNVIRFPPNDASPLLATKKNEVLTFGFLSRIDPKKGLELLFQSLSTIEFAYRLKIAGTGEEHYLASLKRLVIDLGIAQQIEWCGWKGGEEKFQFLQSLDVFVLTSYNENFANSVLESLVIGTPVFLSTGVGLADYVLKNDLGWVCEPLETSITSALNTLYSEKDHLNLIRKKAPILVRKDFDKETIARQYGEAYLPLK